MTKGIIYTITIAKDTITIQLTTTSLYVAIKDEVKKDYPGITDIEVIAYTLGHLNGVYNTLYAVESITEYQLTEARRVIEEISIRESEKIT